MGTVGRFFPVRRLVPAVELPTPARLLAALASLPRMALAERDRWPLWLPVGLGTGIGLYFALPVEPAPAWAGLAALAGVAACFGAAGTGRAGLRVALAALAAIAFGFALAKLRTEAVAAPVLSHKLGPLGRDGRIEQAELLGNGIRFVLGDLRARRVGNDALPARVRISVRADTPLPPPGSWVHVTAVLMPPPAPAAPGAYDFEIGRASCRERV